MVPKNFAIIFDRRNFLTIFSFLQHWDFQTLFQTAALDFIHKKPTYLL